MKQTWITDACSNMDEPQNHFATCQMQDYIESDSIYLKQKRQVEIGSKQEEDTFQVLEVF